MLHGLLRTIGAEIVPFTEEHYDAAVSAFLRYGKGRHPAGLNFGDCMSYALARRERVAATLHRQRFFENRYSGGMKLHVKP